MSEMKLYIWANPYPVSYGSSLLIVAADSLTNAKRIAFGETKAKAYSFGEYEEELPRKFKLGKPTRIVSLPCAEWHEWSE